MAYKKNSDKANKIENWCYLFDSCVKLRIKRNNLSYVMAWFTYNRRLGSIRYFRVLLEVC